MQGKGVERGRKTGKGPSRDWKEGKEGASNFGGLDIPLLD